MIGYLDVGEIRDSERVALDCEDDIAHLARLSRRIVREEILEKKSDRECVENDEGEFVHK